MLRNLVSTVKAFAAGQFRFSYANGLGWRRALAILCAALAWLPTVPAQAGPGDALSFNGTNYVTASLPALTNNYTFSAWVFLRQGGNFPNTRDAILSSTNFRTDGSLNSVELLVRSGTSSYADPQYLELGRSGAFNGGASTNPVPTNQWVHLAVTVSSSQTVNYYINGVASGSWDASSDDVTLNTNLCLANNAINGRRFDGLLDEVQIWSRVLGPTEIRADLNQAYPGSDTNLIAYWQFDQSATNCAPAYWGFYNATLVNSPVYTNSSVPFGCLTTNTVTSQADDGSSGTLRQVIANSFDGQVIVFATNGIITLNGNELVITNSISLAGPGATNLLISGNGNSRVLNLPNASAVVTISDLTICNGSTGYGYTSTDPQSDFSYNGAGICNLGNLTLNRCLIGTNACYYYYGGGIFNNGTLTMTACTIARNFVLNTAPLNTSINQFGGGICNLNGAITMTDCTVCMNRCLTPIHSGSGGGIYNFYGTVTMTSCTVTYNSANSDAYSSAGGYGGDLCYLKNCLIASNAAPWGPDVAATVNSLGHNYINQLAETTIVQAPGSTGGDISGGNALLDLPNYNGGPTPTTALLPGSPAIDAGDDTLAGGTDQRGFFRRAGLHVDIGAYEYESTNVVFAPVVTNSGFNAAGTSGVIHFNFTGPAGQNVVVETCTNLTSPVWLPLESDLLSGSAVLFSATNPPAVPGAFYRLRSP